MEPKKKIDWKNHKILPDGTCNFSLKDCVSVTPVTDPELIKQIDRELARTIPGFVSNRNKK